jgi:hypothetical protein
MSSGGPYDMDNFCNGLAEEEFAIYAAITLCNKPTICMCHCLPNKVNTAAVVEPVLEYVGSR